MLSPRKQRSIGKSALSRMEACTKKHLFKGETWLHPGEEVTMGKWYDWLEEMKKKDERKKMEELHQQRASQMIKSAGRAVLGSCTRS